MAWWPSTSAIPEGSNRLEQVLTATVGIIRHVLRDPVAKVSTVLLASNGRLSAARLSTAALSLPPDLRALAERSAGRLAPGLRGGSVYTDDRAPVEWLVDESIVAYAANDR